MTPPFNVLVPCTRNSAISIMAECGVRVPAIVRWPGRIIAGSVLTK
jgi:hypothetical protein